VVVGASSSVPAQTEDAIVADPSRAPAPRRPKRSIFLPPSESLVGSRAPRSRPSFGSKNKPAEPAKHHIGDFLPPEAYEEFVAKARGDLVPGEQNRITEDNRGHQLLAKMGWQEGAGLGRDGRGLAAPIQVQQRSSNSGIGAETPTSQAEPTPEDDAFALYQKRMALAYRYRPNPLNNPRKQYY